MVVMRFLTVVFLSLPILALNLPPTLLSNFANPKIKQTVLAQSNNNCTYGPAPAFTESCIWTGSSELTLATGTGSVDNAGTNYFLVYKGGNPFQLPTAVYTMDINGN